MPRKSKALQDAEGKASKFQKTIDDGAEGACSLAKLYSAYSLAKLYSTGRGVPQDLKRAQYWAKKAVDEGHLKYSPGLKNWAREECVRWAAGDFGPAAEPVD